MTSAFYYPTVFYFKHKPSLDSSIFPGLFHTDPPIKLYLFCHPLQPFARFSLASLDYSGVMRIHSSFHETGRIPPWNWQTNIWRTLPSTDDMSRRIYLNHSWKYIHKKSSHWPPNPLWSVLADEWFLFIVINYTLGLIQYHRTWLYSIILLKYWNYTLVKVTISYQLYLKILWGFPVFLCFLFPTDHNLVIFALPLHTITLWSYVFGLYYYRQTNALWLYFICVSSRHVHS